MQNVNDDLIAKYITESISVAEVLRKLGYDPRGRNYKIVHDAIKRLNLDYSHFLGKSHCKNKIRIINWNEVLIQKSSVILGPARKKRLVKDGLLIYKCYNEKCGLNSWLGEKISLQLDHINGINNDHRIENLRLLCPNCHSQTPTFAGKNLKGQKRRLVQKNDFCTCGKKKTIRCAMCKECFKQYKADNLTKIKWPSNDDLIQMIKELNYVQVGKILGVSDGAIRHRLKCRGLLPNKKSK